MMSVTTKYEFLIKNINSTKDLDSNICRDMLEIRIVTGKLLYVHCFEIVVMTVIVCSKTVYVLV